MLGIFAQQSLIPSAMSFQAQSSSLSLTLDFDGSDPRAASLLTGRIERIIAIRSISLTMPGE
ncbi:hypothetical protein [Sphingomonas koreensis]